MVIGHREPVAELRPFLPAIEPQSLEARYHELKSLGAISSATHSPRAAVRALRPTRVPGALKRFLKDRD